MQEAGGVRIARIAGLHARGPKATAGAHQLNSIVQQGRANKRIRVVGGGGAEITTRPKLSSET